MLILIVLAVVPVVYFIGRIDQGDAFAERTWRVVGFDAIAWGRPRQPDPPSAGVAATLFAVLLAGLYGTGVLVGEAALEGHLPTGEPTSMLERAILGLVAGGGVGWLTSQALRRQPLVQRLRFTQRQVGLDWIREGFEVSENRFVHARSLKPPTIVAWEEVTSVRFEPDVGTVFILGTHSSIAFGPVEAAVGEDILAQARRRLSVELAPLPQDDQRQLLALMRAHGLDPRS